MFCVHFSTAQITYTSHYYHIIINFYQSIQQFLLIAENIQPFKHGEKKTAQQV